MALKTCKECGKEVSNKADKCPNCGNPMKRKEIGCGSAIVIIVGAFIAYSYIASDRYEITPSTAPADPTLAARGACRIAINNVLNDPRSAQFEPGTTWAIETRGDGTIRVQPKLRAKNAFGAMILSTWDCVTRAEGDNIRVLSLEQISP